MSQENVEVVRRAFAYVFYEGDDRAEAEAIFDAHVVMNPVEEAPLYGVDAIRQNFERWRDAWEELEVAVEEVIDAGDHVFLTAHHRGRGRRSGVEVDSRLYSVYTLRGGKIVREDEYTERAEALEAVRLRNQTSLEEDSIERDTGRVMSQDNLGLARNAVAAFNRRDVPALVEMVTDDFQWVTWTGTVESTVYHGADGLASYFRDSDVWEVLDLEAQEFRDLGDEVLVVGMFHARGGGSGVEIHAPYYSAFFMTGGKLARVLSFRTEAEVLEALGLRE